MGEEAVSISSAGEVWIADASGDALDNVALGAALGDTDVTGTFAEEALGDGGMEESEILMCNTRFPQLLLERTKFPFAFVFLQLDGDLGIDTTRKIGIQASSGKFNRKHMSKQQQSKFYPKHMSKSQRRSCNPKHVSKSERSSPRNLMASLFVDGRRK